MAYSAIHLNHKHSKSFPLNKLNDLLDELNKVKSETDETYVGIVHESEWTLTYYPSGIMSWENNIASLDESWHMVDIDYKMAIELFTHLALGNIDKITKQPWVEGDGYIYEER